VEAGKVVFLSGTSSSGKTTIARALQEELRTPYMLLSTNSLIGLYPERFPSPTTREKAIVTVAMMTSAVSGFHR
jgi:chloramphenicol 3-O-phosphotransferase